MTAVPPPDVVVVGGSTTTETATTTATESAFPAAAAPAVVEDDEDGSAAAAATTRGASAGGGGGGGAKVGPDLNATRGPLDKKLYRQIALPNGLRCLLVEDTLASRPDRAGDGDESDDESESDCEEQDEDASSSSSCEDGEDSSSAGGAGGLRDAAACLLVGVGSAYDPPTCHGLAHFLEHLLFMGSEKYPGENEYESFVSKKGGSDNAWTEWEYTTFQLSIPQDALWPALDRLAQFFVAPLFAKSSVERELKSIESEFLLNKNSDETRRQQLLCGTATPGHWMSKFAWGNIRSLRDIPARLGVDPMKELRKFYNQYYYAANMRLVLVGAYPLDVMQEKVTAMFSEVPALPRAQEADPASPPPLPLPINPDNLQAWDATYQSPLKDADCPFNRDGSLRKIYRIVPVKDRHRLSLTWTLPSVLPYWKSKPLNYIAHLMGHEAEGSLLSYLRSKSWATSCEIGNGDEGCETSSSHTLFTATYFLSEAGVAEWRHVVEATYQYIGMLRMHCRRGFPEWIFDELQRIDQLNYAYADEQDPEDLVEGLAECIAPHYNLPPERLLDGDSLLFEFNPDIIRIILDEYLLPSNARIDLTSSTFGRASDFPDFGIVAEGTEMLIPDLSVGKESVSDDGDSVPFDVSKAGPPQVEPMLGALFWCAEVPDAWIAEWNRLVEPHEPELPIRLPPQNPYIPSNLALKPLPENDAHHPLLDCSLKVCIPVGKTKQWFPATAIRYDRKKAALLLSYEDEGERWHSLDEDDHRSGGSTLDTNYQQQSNGHHHHRHHHHVRPGFEGTFDKKKVKFRVLSVGGGTRRFGDESDLDVEDGIAFPPVPLALSPSRLPREIFNTNVLKLWWLQDRNFHRPIADLRLQFLCSKANSTPLHRTCADLLQQLLVDALTEPAYLASVCDLSYSFSATDVGFTVSVNGFDDKLLDFFRSVMELFLSFAQIGSALPKSIKEERFAACVEVLQRSYKNSAMKAANLCSSLRVRALRPMAWSEHQKLQALQGLDVAAFSRTASSLFEGYAIEGLYHGNVDRSDADKAKDLILNMVGKAGKPGLPRKKYPPQSVFRIPTSGPSKPIPRIVAPSKDPAEPNTAVEVYFQIGKDNLRERVLIELLVHMMDEPFYDQLRTKDQLGYDVSCDVRWTFGIMGMIFCVVTNVKCADDVVERIERFLTDYRQELLAMSSDEYMEYPVGLVKQKFDMFNSLSEETNDYWGEIRDGRFEWQVWRDEAIALIDITKDDVLKAFDDWLMPSSSGSSNTRSVMIAQVIGTGEGQVSRGRPEVAQDQLGDFLDEEVDGFRSSCKNQTWGRVNSKLF